MHIIGEVKGSDCLILDDMIDTAGTLVQRGQRADEAGARAFAAAPRTPCCRARRSSASRIGARRSVVTDTIALSPMAQRTGKFKVLTVAGLLGEAIKRIHNGDSVSSLFD